MQRFDQRRLIEAVVLGIFCALARSRSSASVDSVGMFEVDMRDGSGYRSFWIHSGIPLQFLFFATQYPPINRAWVEAMLTAASGPHGLTLLPEPPAEQPPPA